MARSSHILIVEDDRGAWPRVPAGFLPAGVDFCRPGVRIEARDVIYVTNAPLYEYDKILTSIYKTFSIIGVANGSTAITSSF